VGEPAYSAALGLLCQGADQDVRQALAAACETVPAWDPVIYLADYGHRVLLPLTGDKDPETVAETMAGRAFITGEPVASDRGGSARVWVPVLEQTSRAGVLAVTVKEPDPDTLAQVRLLGVFAGLLVGAAARVSDVPYLGRLDQDMSLAAGMQWDLLPPVSARTGQAMIAGVLEPAYDIAGDAFDYAVNGSDLHFAILDGMGHGIESTLLTALTVGSYRHARRQGAAMPDIHAAVDRALAEQFRGDSFATGIIGRLVATSGHLEWSCAGHPWPLLLRDRKVVAELECEPALPFGLGSDRAPLGEQELQPGDAVLLYTDGVVEARTEDGQLFGLERLIDLFEREAASGQHAEEVLRRLVQAVLDHQGSNLRDDATLLLVQWAGPADAA
jgi:hypothetical protein